MSTLVEQHPANQWRRRNEHTEPRTRPCAFTLVEVLLALAICAIVLVAINAVFATAVRLRDRTSANVDQSLPVNFAFEKIRGDLKSVVGPFGFLAGDFKCDAQTMGASMGLSASSGGGLDFFASSGVIGDEAPWGDIQEVYYQLMPATDRRKSLGLDFVRCVNRNLLATTTHNPGHPIAHERCREGGLRVLRRHPMAQHLGHQLRRHQSADRRPDSH